MITQISYKYSPEDWNWPLMIEQAFNRMYEFSGDLFFHDRCGGVNPIQKSFNRITNGEWDEIDVGVLKKYSDSVCDAAEQRYSSPPFNKAMWKDSVLQSAKHLRDTMADFVKWFEEQREHYVQAI